MIRRVRWLYANGNIILIIIIHLNRSNLSPLIILKQWFPTCSLAELLTWLLTCFYIYLKKHNEPKQSLALLILLPVLIKSLSKSSVTMLDFTRNDSTTRLQEWKEHTLKMLKTVLLVDTHQPEIITTWRMSSWNTPFNWQCKIRQRA